MRQAAKIFTTGRSQAVRLPLEFRFDTCEVYVRRDPAIGEVILSPRPNSWAGFFALDATTEAPSDFLNDDERQQGDSHRDPLAIV